MYVRPNFKTKKALKEAVTMGKKIQVFEPFSGKVMHKGTAFVEGPHSPESHTWYATVWIEDWYVTEVRT